MASDGFIREVDEELQRDRMTQLWNRYGPLAVGIALIVILAVAGKVGWDAWQARQLAQQGAAFASAEAARTGANPAAAINHYGELAEAAGGNVAALARLRQAEAAVAAGDSATAISLLESVAASSGIDPVLRDVALVSLNLRRLDAQDTATFLQSLASLDASSSTFAFTARELTALGALINGDESTAISTLQALRTDSGTPDGVRNRAEALLAALGVEDPSHTPLSAQTEEAS